ncbi:hypothetical protein CDN99_13470 [Roseateles aquatilis]|uniref:Anti-sigma K factor RskA C-terminal domain-containing protein n=1 Tax=Roseateles aquatilis TaxID=431061 RepID=A0A246JCP9_9BURK|nr:anti-sigma factor [Roseateles aquatilis]OWQ90364.1 hypothetical protein CDN99_13470 [Roseateles aquatilis]
MDYGHPERADLLAAEYALGTLRGGARRRFERLLPAHPALRSAVAAWQTRLQLLAGQVQPVEPPVHVWRAVQQRLFGASAPAGDVPRASGAPAGGWWHRLGLWRGISAATTAAAVALAVMVIRPEPVTPPVVIVLESTAEGLQVVKTGFVASVSADGRALVLRPLGPLSLDARHALELWAVPKQGSPRSLGLIATGAASTTVIRAGLLQDTNAFAVSLEPAGGSPSGAPTGPIVSAGGV